MHCQTQCVQPCYSDTNSWLVFVLTWCTNSNCTHSYSSSQSLVLLEVTVSVSHVISEILFLQYYYYY